MAESVQETLRRLREQAWDEGYAAASNRKNTDRSTWKTNPYRKQ